MNDVTKMFLDDVLAEMRLADELGGPTGLEYVELMVAISVEANRRATTAAARIDDPEAIRMLLVAAGWAVPAKISNDAT